MKIIYYIAYGSNLNLENFLRRCPSAKLLGTTFLTNKTLAFKGDDEGFSYLTLEDEVGNVVPVGVFELSYIDVLRLDKYEGYPTLYSKQYINLHLNSHNIRALYYVMNSKYNYYLPSLDYFASCVKGYETFKFDKKFLVQALKRTNERVVKKAKK